MSIFSSVQDLTLEIQNGRMIILVDNEDRENEGDLVIAAQFVNDQHINFMATEGRGLICLALPPSQVDQLKLPLMKSEFHESAKLDTAFTMSIEAKHGVKTGISCQDRARTIQVAISPVAKPQDLVVPGHIFPLRSHMLGLKGRNGHTEASLDLVEKANLSNKSAVICEILNFDGTMSRQKDLILFAKKHGLKLGTIQSLIDYKGS